MKIRINSNEELIKDRISLKELLEAKKMIKRSIVWLNGNKIKTDEYPNKTVTDGDSIKIIRILAGG